MTRDGGLNWGPTHAFNICPGEQLLKFQTVSVTFGFIWMGVGGLRFTICLANESGLAWQRRQNWIRPADASR